MKQSKRDDLIQERMQPGGITREGLMGDDTRKLRDIIEADGAAVARLGLTHAALAARMRELRQAGARGLGEFVKAPDHFEVRVDAVRGRLPCPFGHPGMYLKEFIVVRNMRLGEEVIFSRLSIHLIETHGFYEGLGSPYRLDPAALARILECDGLEG